MRARAHRYYLLRLSVALLLLSGCQKETIFVEDNNAPTLNHTPAIKIENYVNRLFIDLLGREPIDAEMEAEVQALKAAGLTADARESLITRLQTGTDYIAGDTSYAHAYHQQLYDRSKIRLLEGISDAAIIDEFLNDADPDDSARIILVLHSREDLRTGSITYDQMLARMLYNPMYDQINMNSFNFVNAAFDNLLWRYPTNAEFDAGFRMVEQNAAATLFGQTGQNKADFVNIVTNSGEMLEGIIIWAYRQLLARSPTTEETAALLTAYIDHRDIRIVQRQILKTDEYANF